MQDAFEHIYRQINGAAEKLNPPASRHKRDAQNFIRPGEVLEDLFSDDQLVLFQKRTALFMRRSFPAYAKTLMDAELEKLAVNVQKRAAAKGFITEKHIWHYLIAIVYCGFFFEQDMQYADMLALIGWHEAYSDKALLLDRLLDIVDEYALECEKDFAGFDKKLHYIAGFYTSPHFSGRILENLPQQEQFTLGEEIVRAVFPVRAELWTPENRYKIITMSLDHAGRIGFTVKDGLFYLLANIYFGRAFEQSPFYPWAYFLQNRNIPALERGKHFVSLLQKHFAQLAAG